MKNLFINNKIKKFINFTEKFENYDCISKEIILVEFNGWQPFHIASLYLINILRKKYKCKVMAYQNFDLLNFNKQNFLDKLRWHFGSKIKLKTFGIYNAMGVNSFFKSKKKKISNFLLKKELKKIKSLSDLEKYKYKNILIGDLIYDSYLKKNILPTIDINSKKFSNYFSDFLGNFIFWNNFFLKNKVKAVIASHGVYSLAIPLRVAIKNNIDSFVPNEEKLFNLKYTPKNKFISPTSLFQEPLLFKKYFNKFTNIEKKRAITFGRKIVQKHLKDNFNYSYVRKKKNKISKKKTDKTKKTGVLIASHSFFDSPHVFGKNLFPDFKVWLNFLTSISKKTNYNWYIKSHPNKFDLTDEVIRKILNENKHIKLIDESYNYKDLKNINIKAILTVYGSVSKESFFHKILAFNASKSNPASKLSFSITPKSVEQFKKLILNLENTCKKFFQNQKKIKTELYMYYYMDKFFFHKNYLFQNFEKYIFSKNSRKDIFTNEFYEDWINNNSSNLNNLILNRIEKFINSKDYVLSKKHD